MAKDLSRRRVDGGAEVRRQFTKNVLPEIGALPLASLRRAHIAQLLDNVAKTGVTRTVGVILADLRQMFNFALVRELMPSDPTLGLKKAHWGGVAQECDRVLSGSEIHQLAAVLPNADLVATSQHTIWIMLSTLARIGEISKAKWSHVNFETCEWKIVDPKNGIDHVVDLSPFALSHFRALHASAQAAASSLGRDMSDYVLPARVREGPVCKKSLTKQIGDRQRKDKKPMSRRSPKTESLTLPGGEWSPHDLRRTGATLMGELGVRPDVIEKCLNHVEQNKMKRIYQRQSLRHEMREAWKLLGEHLTVLMSSSRNIITGTFGKQ